MWTTTLGIFYKKQDKDSELLNASGSQDVTILGSCHPRMKSFSKVIAVSLLLDPLKSVKSQGVYLLDMGFKLQATPTGYGCPVRIAHTKSMALVDSLSRHKALIAQA